MPTALQEKVNKCLASPSKYIVTVLKYEKYEFHNLVAIMSLLRLLLCWDCNVLFSRAQAYFVKSVTTAKPWTATQTAGSV